MNKISFRIFIPFLCILIAYICLYPNPPSFTYGLKSLNNKYDKWDSQSSEAPSMFNLTLLSLREKRDSYPCITFLILQPKILHKRQCFFWSNLFIVAQQTKNNRIFLVRTGVALLWEVVVAFLGFWICRSVSPFTSFARRQTHVSGCNLEKIPSRSRKGDRTPRNYLRRANFPEKKKKKKKIKKTN